MVKYLKVIPKDWPGDKSEFEPGWWIKDPTLPDILYIGPYDTKKEADEEKHFSDWLNKKGKRGKKP
jgi:hypothetical protein